MNDFAASVALWLADYFLLGTILLVFALAAFIALKQPAHRLAVTKSTIVALALLAVLCALPGWSLIHLIASETPLQQRSDGPPIHDGGAHAPIDAPISKSTLPSSDLVHSAPIAVANNIPAHKDRLWTELNPLTILCVGYISGSMMVAAWLALGVLATRRLIRRARPASDELLALLTKVNAHASARTRLLISQEISVAIALGIRRPTIVLPKSLLEPQSAIPATLRIPRSDIENILAHELAHITNRDLHWLAASRALLVLLWPQPLFWFVRRCTRLDQEALADAAAAEVTSRHLYAEQLVSWARQLPPHSAPRLSAAVGLWEGPSQLRQRIALLLDEHFTVLRHTSRRLRLSALSAAIVFAVALSTVTFQPQHFASAEPDTPTTDSDSKPPADIPHPIPNTVLGRTLDENSQPITGAEVFLFRVNRQDGSRALISQKSSGPAGNFRFENVIDIPKEFPDGNFSIFGETAEDVLQLIVRAPGRVTDDRLLLRSDVAKRGELAMIKMPPAATLQGRVIGPDGKPVDGALVSVGLPTFTAWECARSARTDSDGNYSIDDVASFDIESFRQQQEAERQRREELARNGATGVYTIFHAPPTLTVEHPNFAVKKTGYDKIPGTKDVQLDPPAVIEGRVIDAVSKKPVADVLVNATTSRPEPAQVQLFSVYDYYQAKVRTDADGRYRFATLPAGKYDLWADADDRVNFGIQNLVAPANQTTVPADLILTTGGLLHLRLVDAKTGEPIELPSGTQASYTAVPKKFAGSRPMLYQTSAPLPDGTFELRVLPGENQIYLAGATVDGEYKWAGTTTSGGKPTEVEVAEGQTVTADVPVVALNKAQAESKSQATVHVDGSTANDRGDRGRVDILSKELQDHPDNPVALLARSEARQRLGEYAKAIADLEHLIRLDPPPPKNFIARNNLAALLGAAPDNSLRDGQRAVKLAKRAQQLAGQPNPDILDTLAAAYAETGDFDDAIKTQQKAIELRPASDDFRQHLQLYRNKQPLREHVPPPPTNPKRPAIDRKNSQNDDQNEYTFPITVSGRALSQTGTPIAGADIYLAAESPGYKRLAQTTTDSDGRYEFTNVPLPIQRADTIAGRDSGAFEVFGIADGYALTWRPTKWFYPLKDHLTDLHSDPEDDQPPGYGNEDPIELDLTFGPSHTLRGRVVGELLQPIPNTTLSLRYADPNWDQSDFNRMSNGNELASLNERAIVPPSVKIRTTDSNGRFEFTGLPADHRWWIDVRAPGHPPRRIWAVTHKGITADKKGNRVYSGDFELIFPKPRQVKIRVVYGDTGKPAPLVGIGGNVAEAGFWETTDVDGLVEVPLPEGKYKLGMLPRWHTPYLRSEGQVTVGHENLDEVTTFTLRPAAIANITVTDANTGAPLQDVDVWRDEEFPGSNRPPYRRVHGNRSWGVETRISRYDSPRTDKNGKMQVLFEPGKHRIGVGKEAFPAGYEPVEPDGKEVELIAGEPQTVAFQLRPSKQAASSLEVGPVVDVAHTANQPIDIYIIIARHHLFYDGEFLSWPDIEQMIAGFPNPKLVRVNIRTTSEAPPYAEGALTDKIHELEKKYGCKWASTGGVESRASARYDAIRSRFDLIPNEAWRVEGVVINTDGEPAADAQVVLCPPVDESVQDKKLNIYIRNGQLFNPPDEIVTLSGANGKFAVYPSPGAPYYLVALHPDGFGFVRSDEFASAHRIELKPWARVRGLIKVDPRFKQSVMLSRDVPAVDGWPEVAFPQDSVNFNQQTEDGHFKFEFAPPGTKVTLQRIVGNRPQPYTEFELLPGQEKVIDIELPSKEEGERFKKLKQEDVDLFGAP